MSHINHEKEHELKIIPCERHICDSSQDPSVAEEIPSADWALFPCDGSFYTYNNGTIMWNPATSSFHNSIENSVILFTIRGQFFDCPKESYVDIKIIVHHPTLGDLDAGQHTFEFDAKVTDAYKDWAGWVYAGEGIDFSQNPFTIYYKASTTAMKMKFRSIKLAC